MSVTVFWMTSGFAPERWQPPRIAWTLSVPATFCACLTVLTMPAWPQPVTEPRRASRSVVACSTEDVHRGRGEGGDLARGGSRSAPAPPGCGRGAFTPGRAGRHGAQAERVMAATDEALEGERHEAGGFLALSVTGSESAYRQST